ncbi:MAG: DUF2339 domain-containing protein, partial [Patescibacteria group bacterium]|nr:DUF2339 domain-containing protein [Patescibacteria group bacterium]
AIFVISLYTRVSKLEKTIYSNGPHKAAEPFRPAPSQGPAAPVPVFQPTTPPPAPPPVYAQTPRPIERDRTSEFAIGSKWFISIGAIAVLIGIGFFFRYAFANNLISEPMRVVLGTIFGAVLMGIGHWLKERYRNYGLTLIGVGLGAVYISFFAAYALYNLMSPFTSFTLVVFVALIGVAYAIAYDSKHLGGVALAGGYISVLLYVASLTLMQGFSTLFLLALLVIIASYFRKWPEIVTAGLAFTTLTLLSWTAMSSVSLDILVPLTSLLFGIFTISTIFNFSADETYSPWQVFNLYATPFAYFIYLSPHLTSTEDAGLLAFGIALVYGLLGLVTRALSQGQTSLRKFAQTAMFLTPAFIALGIGLYFSGNTRVMLLVLEGAVAIVSGLMFSSVPQYYLGQVLLGIGTFAALVTGMSIDTAAPFVFNERVFTLTVTFLSLLAGWASHYWRPPVFDQENASSTRKVDALVLYFIAAFTVVTEVNRLHFQSYESLAAAAFSLAVVTLVMYLLGVIWRESVLRVAGYVVLGIAGVFAVFAVHMSGPHTPFFDIYTASMVSVVTLAAIMYAVLRADPELAESEFGKTRAWLLLCANVVAILVGTSEIQTYFTPIASYGADSSAARIAISIFWLAYGVVGLLVGIMKRSTFCRQFAIVLFVITTLKVFLYDSLMFSDLYRFMSFITLGLILLIVGYLYVRFKERIRSFVGLSEEKTPMLYQTSMPGEGSRE